MNSISIRLTIFFFCCGLVSCDKQCLEKNSTDEIRLTSENVVAPEGMVWIPGGTYWRGNDKDPGNLARFLEGVTDPQQRAFIRHTHFIEEKPVHQCSVDGFFMDETEVTNAQFEKFVEATGYVTLSEKGLKAEDFPNAPTEALEPGANVYSKPREVVDVPQTANTWRWWAYTKGANWRCPEGPGSSIKDKMDHPVVCMNYDDALAYATWAGKRLPTEAEWERAARGGLEKQMFIWGNRIQKNGEWMANCYQGDFPNHSIAKDGYHLSAPVKSYPPNDYGLYDMAGNVWEICSDYYHPYAYQAFVKNPMKNPLGPESPITQMEQSQLIQTGASSTETVESHPLLHLRTVKGGSFLCHFSYCLRFRPASRHYHEPLTPAHHTGFRCVMDAPKNTP